MSGSHASWIPDPSLQGAPAQSTLAGFSERMRVIYVPYHAHGDRNHKDCEHGRVSSVNHKFVFVKFDRQVQALGWDEATACARYPDTLVMEMPTDLHTLAKE